LSGVLALCRLTHYLHLFALCNAILSADSISFRCCPNHTPCDSKSYGIIIFKGWIVRIANGKPPTTFQ